MNSKSEAYGRGFSLALITNISPILSMVLKLAIEPTFFGRG